MSRNRDISNSRQNRTEASQELKALRKRIPGHALLFTARASIHAGMPPLISYVSQQSRDIGETNRQLERQVMHHNSWASSVPRAMHLPVLSRVLDFIQRTTAFISPMYQRMLDLTWFRRRRKPRRSYTHTRGATAERQPSIISLQSNELYPDRLLQTLGDTEEEQVVDEANETYRRATERTYPMTSSALLLPLPMRMEPAITAHDFPHAVSPTVLPQHTRKIMAQYDQNVQTRPLHLAAKEQPDSRANETATVIKNWLSSRAAGIRLADTDSEASHYARPTYMTLGNKQITHSLESEGGSEPISRYVGQSDTTVAAMRTPYEIREPDHTQAKAVEGRLTEVNRQPHHKYRTQTLSPVLMPIAQRIGLHRRSMKAGSPIIGEGIRETHYPNIFCIGTSGEQVVPAVHTSHPLTLSQQPATEEPERVLHASPAWSGFTISGEALRGPSPSKSPMIARYPTEMASGTLLSGDALRGPSPSKPPMIARHPTEMASGTLLCGDALRGPSPSKPPMIARYPTGMASGTVLPEALTESEGTEMLPRRISRQPVLQIGQARRQKPLVTSRKELPGGRADYIYQTERMMADIQSEDTVNMGTSEHARIGPRFARVPISKPPFYSQPLSVAASFVHPSPAYESIDRAMTLAMQQFYTSIYDTNVSSKTENYGFVPNRERISSRPDEKYAYRQASELALPSLLQEKAESNTAYRKEALTDTPDIFLELKHSRVQEVPELALAPISRQSETLTPPIVPELQKEESSQGVAKDELDDIARDVYNILKRRLVRERERALGVI